VGKRPLGRPRYTWVNDIKMDLVEIVWCDVDWIGLDQDRYRWRAVVNAVMNLRVPHVAGGFLSGCRTDGPSSFFHLHGELMVFSNSSRVFLNSNCDKAYSDSFQMLPDFQFVYRPLMA
jgi:hypothetical protein